MNTLSTVTAYERTPSGAHKITFLGETVAGTFDDEIGALAERLAAQGAEANPVELAIDIRDGVFFVTSMTEIPVSPEHVADAEAVKADIEDAIESDITEGEAMARNLEEAAAYIRQLQS